MTHPERLTRGMNRSLRGRTAACTKQTASLALAVALSLGGALAGASPASAALIGDPAVELLSNPSGGAGGFTASVQGWRFQAEEDVSVTALGLADINGFGPGTGALDGFAHPHSVILWDSGGNSLASTTIQAGTASPVGPGTLVMSFGTGQFRYESLATPLPLTAGGTYVISAFYPVDFSNSDALAAPQAGSTLTTPSFVTPRELRFFLFGFSDPGSHVFPTGSDSRFALTVGPTFLATPTHADSGGDTVPVPEPGALPLLVSSLATLAVLGWRQRRRAA
jgi:hypothetical protein